MGKYRKKPIEIEAVRFTNETKDSVYTWAKSIQGNISHNWDIERKPILIIPTLEGEMKCSLGDYLIVEPFPTDWRKIYPCKPSIFDQTYESVAEKIMKTHALILPGGGSNGAWQAGKLTALWPGIEDDIGAIFCNSIGSANGIMAATGQVHLLEGIWTNMSPSQAYRKRRNISLLLNLGFYKLGIAKPKLAKWSNDPFRKLLRKHVVGKKVNVDYWCSYVIVQRPDQPTLYRQHKIAKGQVVTESDLDYIIGSTAIPVVFDPVEKENELLVDGGMVYKSPIHVAMKLYDLKKLTAIACQPRHPKGGETPGDIIEMSGWTIATLTASDFYEEWNQMEKWNQAAKQANLVIDGHPVIHYEWDLHFPEEDLGNSLDFSSKKTAPNFYLGLSV